MALGKKFAPVSNVYSHHLGNLESAVSFLSGVQLPDRKCILDALKVQKTRNFQAAEKSGALGMHSVASAQRELCHGYVINLYLVYTIKQTSSKSRANAFKIHVLITRRLFDVCLMFASIHPASSTSYGRLIIMLIRRADGL